MSPGSAWPIGQGAQTHRPDPRRAPGAAEMRVRDPQAAIELAARRLQGDRREAKVDKLSLDYLVGLCAKAGVSVEVSLAA